ncbi:MAG: outer membrane lipoprotein-sorting protein [Nitrospirota bacterium]
MNQHYEYQYNRVKYPWQQKKEEWIALLLLILISFSSNNTWALSPEEKGRQIAIEADQRDMGWRSGKNDGIMILKNRNGQISTRKIRSRLLEGEKDGDKFLIIFDHPPDIKGTAFLSYTHINRQDEQWLYLPALKRIKRIASNNQSGPFMGSEFAYEDIISQEVDNYTYKYLRDEKLNGLDCFVVERYPVDPNSSYKRHVVWYDKEEYRMQKNDLYDRYNNRLIKTLTFIGHRLYLNKYWRADEYHMVNHITGKETVFVWKNRGLHSGYTARDFTKNSLKSVR